MIARVGLAAPGLLAVGHDEMVVDALQMAAIGQQPPVVGADAVRRQVFRQGVPGDAVQDFPKHMLAGTPASLRDGQQRLENSPFRVGEVTRISLAPTIVARPISVRPNHGSPIQPLTTCRHATPLSNLYYQRLSHRTLSNSDNISSDGQRGDVGERKDPSFAKIDDETVAEGWSGRERDERRIAGVEYVIAVQVAYEAQGAERLVDRRRGRASARRAWQDSWP
jgi:hypothetical protein